MRLLKALKRPKYLLLAIIAALGIGLFLPLVQTGLLLNNLDVWFLTLLGSPLNTALYFAFSALFGLLIALQVYNVKDCKDCNIKKGSATGFGGATFGFVLGVCPACIGLIGLILPLSVSITLTAYSSVLTGAAIIIMLFSIKLLGGFKKN